MSYAHDQRSAPARGPATTPSQPASQDPSELLALLDDTSPEALMMAQGLMGNSFSQECLATSLAVAGGLTGALLGGTLMGLPGGVAGGLVGGFAGFGFAAALGLDGDGAEADAATTPEAPVTEAPVATGPASEAPALDATPLPTKAQTREELIAAYQAWLDLRLAEVAGLEGDEKARRVEGLLDQAGRVYAQLEQGQMVDIDQLDAAPASQGATHVAGTAPPELVGPTRALIAQVEVDIEGATADQDALPETSRSSGVDWNSRLGVPQYRNQNDNTVASFVTCNVTSGMMVLERVGCSRDDIKAATQRELTEAWIIEQQAAWQQANGTPMPAEQVDGLRAQGPSDEWVQGRIAAYFEEAEAEAQNGSAYRQMRSGNDADLTGEGHEEARETVAGRFMEDAQSEELLDLLMQLHNHNGGFADIREDADLGEVRRSIGIASVADELLALIDPETAAAGTRRGCEPISGSWADAKPKIKACLEAGGGAQMSVKHKAQKEESHLVSVQCVTAGGVVIDDPYGRIGASYDHDTTAAGTSAYKSTVNGTVNPADAGTAGVVDDDWTWRQGQQLSGDEQAGMSRALPDSQISTMFKYVTLYHRPGAS